MPDCNVDAEVDGLLRGCYGMSGQRCLGTDNFFIVPTILDDVNPDMHLARVEAFGPVANLLRTRDLNEALDWINNKDAFGHSACIFTRDGGTARKFMKEVDVGNIGINVPVPQLFAFFPLGSKNESALGIAKSGIDSLRLFLDQKTVTERWA
jgi:malonate-semialdehyde dehydrogenase (acetylating)/methylmalonate-semialdehyde dehydrogenase